MRTIDKILRYKFNRSQRRYFIKKWYINGCWGKWGFSFSDSIEYSISQLKGFKKERLARLWSDIEKLCGEHDIDFTLWKTKWRFIKANFIFVRWLFKLLWWGNFFWRLTVAIIVFILLNRHWKKYFNWEKDITLEDLFE